MEHTSDPCKWPAPTDMQQASPGGGRSGAQPRWRNGEQPAPRSRWKTTGLLTELPKPSDACIRLLSERRGQLLMQQAANLCNAQTCSRLLMVVPLLLPLLADQCGA